MPNTTTIAITCFSNESGIARFMESTGLELHQIIDRSKLKRSYVVSMEFWAVSLRCGFRGPGLDSSEIYVDEILAAFKATEFDEPENVCLIIDCDDNEEQSGCYPLVTVGIAH